MRLISRRVVVVMDKQTNEAFCIADVRLKETTKDTKLKTIIEKRKILNLKPIIANSFLSFGEGWGEAK